MDARLPAHEVSELFVLQKAAFFTDLGLWPDSQKLDPHGWLRNFTDVERPFAVHLLNVFLFFNENLGDALLRAAVQSLGAEIVATATSLAAAKSDWRSFLSALTVSFVHGEHPQVTDSGHIFARKARQVLLEIPEHQILQPGDAISALGAKSAGTLLLLDDFVGSGRQMETSWTRPYKSASGKSGTLLALSENGIRVIYAPLVATSYGVGQLKKHCPGMEVRAAHQLDHRYSLTDAESILWPASLRSQGQSFLFDVSDRAGIVDDAEYGWQGFHDLALALGFWHSVPDATLPLFYWDVKGWIPLIRRT